MKRKTMKRMIVLLITTLILISGAIYLLHPFRHEASNAHGEEGCVKKTLKKYGLDLSKFQSNLRKIRARLDSGTQQQQPGYVGLNPDVIESKNVPTRPATPRNEGRLVGTDPYSLKTSCEFPPYGISGGHINRYPTDLPHYCEGFDASDPNHLSLGNVVAPSYSVGRLKLRSKDGEFLPEMWGTGFVIAKGSVTNGVIVKGVIATSCHAIDSLLVKDKDHPGKWILPTNTRESLKIDFKDGPSQDSKYEFDVGSFLGCGSRQGLDIALLEVALKNDNNDDLPPPLQLYAGLEDPDPNPDHRLAAVGYADLDHPIDADTQEMYQPYEKKEYPYVKFVMVNSVSTIDTCDDDLSLLLDTADTTMGESGSPVMDLTQFSGKPLVVGVHTCCAAYFKYQKAEPPEHALSASWLRRTYRNQDVSSWSILKDTALCKVLNQYQATEVDNKGKSQTVSCRFW